MAIRFEIDDANVRAVRFAVSPLVEAALSLNAFFFPRARSLHHEWIRSLRRMPVSWRRELEAFGFVLDWAIPDCLLPEPGRSPASWSEELGRVAALDPERAVYELLRPAFHYVIAGASEPDAVRRPEVRAQVLARADRHGSRARRLARRSFSAPAETRDRFVALLDDYWQRGFAEEWSRLEPRLLAIARRDARTVSASGVYAILDGRFADTVVDREHGWLERASPHDHTVRPSRRRPLMLIPSVFVWPHIRVNCDAPWPLAMIYPPGEVVTEGRVAAPPVDILAVQRALAEPARLQLLRATATRGRSTEELAHLVGLSPAGTSKHLHLLADAGLVRRRRDGYYVLYQADGDALDRAFEELRGYLGAAG